LRVAGMLHVGKLPTLDDLMACFPGLKKGFQATTAADCWTAVTMAVEWNVSEAGIKIVPAPPRGDTVTPRVVLRGEGLYAAITAQLLFAVCRVDGFAVCVSCGSSFIPRRRTRRSQRCYCESCRKKSKAPIRDAMRDYRRRKGEAAALRAKGLSIHAIAQRLSITESRVCRYLCLPQP
jgi:transposase-like protein